MRYKCVVAYDGSNFHGFQTQHDLRTVETELEKAISKVCKQNVLVYASGRTDSGVHAIGQVIHFDTVQSINPEGMKRAINALLPKDIYIKEVEIVENSFHSRYSSHKKEYHYLVDIGEYNPLYANYRTYYMYKKLDIEKVKEALSLYIGEHDFRSFTKNSELENTVRTIYEIDFNYENGLMKFRFLGNGFLHNQIRIMTAMALEVGRGKITINGLQEIMDKKNRIYAPKVLSASGLYLYKVYY